MDLYIIRDGNPEGPYPQEQIEQMLGEGSLTTDDMVAAEDWAEPISLGELIVHEPDSVATGETPEAAPVPELAPARFPQPSPDPRLAARKLPKGKIIDPKAPPPKSTGMWWFLIMILAGI